LRISTGHIRKRKGALWEGQYVYQKQKRSIYGKNEEEVKKEMVKIMESIENNTYVKPGEVKNSSWMREWYQIYAITTLRPSTSISYESIIEKHIIPYFGDMLLKNISVKKLQEFFNF